MPQPLAQQLREENRTIMDIVQQGLDTGAIRLNSDAVKKQIADLLDKILVAGTGVTITYDESAVTITFTSP